MARVTLQAVRRLGLFTKRPICLALGILLNGQAQADGLLAIDNPARNGTRPQAYASVQAFEGNDQVAMREFGANWHGDYTPRPGANLALQVFRAEAGTQWFGYRLGLLARGLATAQTNRDTSDLIHQNKLALGYDIGRSYTIDYKLQGFDATGVRLSKSFSLAAVGPWHLQWGAGASYLRAQSVKLASSSGSVTTLNTKDFNASVGMVTSDNRINQSDLTYFNAPFGRITNPTGEGYALDLGLLLAHEPSGLEFDLAINDLTGQMTWRDLPRNVETFNNSNKFFDANGFVQFNPTTTRTSSFANTVQTLDPKAWLAVSYPWLQWRVQAGASILNGQWLPQLDVKYSFHANWQLTAQYDTYFKTYGLLLQTPYFQIGIRADQFNPDQTKAMGVFLALNLPLD